MGGRSAEVMEVLHEMRNENMERRKWERVRETVFQSYELSGHNCARMCVCVYLVLEDMCVHKKPAGEQA